MATWGERALAYLITMAFLIAGYVVVLIVSAIFGTISDILGGLVAFVGYLAMFGASIYVYYLDGATGGHPGKRLMGLKTVHADTGQTIGGGMGIVRYLAHFIDSAVCCIGWLLPLWDDKHQTIADKVVTTVVVSGQPKVDLGPRLFTT